MDYCQNEKKNKKWKRYPPKGNRNAKVMQLEKNVNPSNLIELRETGASTVAEKGSMRVLDSTCTRTTHSGEVSPEEKEDSCRPTRNYKGSMADKEKPAEDKAKTDLERSNQKLEVCLAITETVEVHNKPELAGTQGTNCRNAKALGTLVGGTKAEMLINQTGRSVDADNKEEGPKEIPRGIVAWTDQMKQGVKGTTSNQGRPKHIKVAESRNKVKNLGKQRKIYRSQYM